MECHEQRRRFKTVHIVMDCAGKVCHDGAFGQPTTFDCSKIPKRTSTLNDESDVIGGIVGRLFSFRRFPATVVVPVGVNTVNYVSASELSISERSAIERIFWNGIKKPWREFLQVSGQVPSIVSEAFHRQSCGRELDVGARGCITHNGP